MSLSERPVSSLRSRLIVGMLIIVPPMLIVAGLVLDYLISTALTAQFDDALEAEASSLALLVEQDEDGIDFELKDVRLPEFEPGPTAEYFQIRVIGGEMLARSNSLGEQGALLLGDGESAVGIDELALANGTVVRRVVLRLKAKQDEDFAETGAAPVTIEVAVARPIAPLHLTKSRLRLTLGCVGGSVLAALLLLLTARVNRELRPLAELSRTIAGIASESLSTRLSIHDLPAEVVPVVQRLNDLLARLAAAFDRERRFTSDAAHELRTPLAGIRATVEVALLRERPIEDCRDALRTTLTIVTELQQLVESLLQLARADASGGAAGAVIEPVDLAQLLRECWGELAGVAAERTVSASFQLENASPVESNSQLLRIAMRNLLRNAAQHADPESEVAIRVAPSAGGERISLSIENRCRSLDVADLERVFDRFWRREQSHGVATDRYGIGLPLARAILETLGGTISATMPRAGAFCIEVRLPARALQ